MIAVGRHLLIAMTLAAATASSHAQPPAVARAASDVVQVRVQTDLGDFVLEVDMARAPATAANFMRYVDAGHYDGGTFHRTVRLDNQPQSAIKIEVVQAAANPSRATAASAPVALERTSVTGLRHRDGVISMARDGADTATSDWFVCINDQPSLDFGGQRNPDGQGFAAFGRVVSGMDVVRRIQASPTTGDTASNAEAQKLAPPIRIITASRIR